MYIIISEPLDKGEQFNTKELDKDNIPWFRVPVIRENEKDKEIIVRYISATEFYNSFNLSDRRTKNRYLEENALVDEFISGKTEESYFQYKAVTREL